MTTYIEKVLGDGQLPSAKTALYTSPGATRTNVRFFRGSNVGGAKVTVNIYFNPSGVSRRLFHFDLDVDESFKLIQEDVPQLEAADTIEADCTLANAVDYMISGIQAS